MSNSNRENGQSRNHKRINVVFTQEEYEAIKQLAERTNKSMSQVVGDFTRQGLNGTLTTDNMEFIVPIIRQQLKDILLPMIDRVSTISAKACIQAGAAAYLSAEALSRFVPEEERADFVDAYELARKKAVNYLRKSRDEV